MIGTGGTLRNFRQVLTKLNLEKGENAALYCIFLGLSKIHFLKWQMSIHPHCTRPSSLDNAGQQQQQRQHEECMQSIHQVSGSLYCKDHFRISTWIRGLAGWRDQTATQNKKSSQYSKIKEIVHYFLSLLDNAPNQVVGCVIQKRYKDNKCVFFHLEHCTVDC